MEKRTLEIGDVLQLRPEHRFGGALLVVTEPKSWGCQGYLMMPRIMQACRYNGRAFIRSKFENMEFVGKLEWIDKEDMEKENEE
jgi:hypothetical protein